VTALLNKLSARAAFALAALVCAALLGFGFYLQYGPAGLDPCPLCLVQRGFFFGVLGICALGALHGPRGGGAAVYGGLALLSAIGGIGAAGRQVWLQHLPEDKVPQCGPDLYFMIENFPLGRTIRTLIEGTGECAKVDWTFLGLSIAEWSLIWFSILAIGALWVSLRALRRPLP
jgi:disulfide bond formation protein DsbB